MPVSLVALKKLTYAGQTYLAGEAFEARDAADATVLKMTKLADTAPEPEPEPAHDPDAQVSLEIPGDAPEEDAPVRRRRAYRRKDVTAEP